MVEKVYIVWAQINKNTAKFDLGTYPNKILAETVKTSAIKVYKLVWVSEYKLSKPTLNHQRKVYGY